jgi:DNA-directed RNA polymerase subunit K/omega
MVPRPVDLSAFEFAVLSGLRAHQLALGCTPRVTRSEKLAITAQMEIAGNKIERLPNRVPSGRTL